jgi:hypothetical protein
MLNVQKFTTVLQIAGAALGIPAAAGGTYTVYRSYFASTANCQTLRASLLATMDQAISIDARRALMKKEFAEFKANCAAADPDAIAVFSIALQPSDGAKATPIAAAPPSPAAATAVAAQSGAIKTNVSASTGSEPNIFAGVPAGVFGVSAAGEPHGWVALDRRDPDHFGESSFAGYVVGKDPAEKSILNASWPVPVWREPQPPGPPEVAKVQGRLAKGECVRVLSFRLAPPRRPWADVEPAACAPAPAK